MTDFPHASLAYFTEPLPGQAVLNIQIESGDEPVRVIVNRDQLTKMIADAVRIEYGYVEARA